MAGSRRVVTAFTAWHAQRAIVASPDEIDDLHHFRVVLEELGNVAKPLLESAFLCEQEPIGVAQLVNLKMRIAEVPVPTRYFPEASSASFVQSSIYGLSILWLLLKYQLHGWGLVKQRSFESLRRRYSASSGSADAVPDGEE